MSSFHVFRFVKTRKFSCLELQLQSEITMEGKMQQKESIFVFVDFSCEYTSRILRSSIRKMPLCRLITDTVSGGDFHYVIQFCDFEYIDWDPVLKGKQFASSYLTRKGLSRKAQLALQIKKYIAKHPKSILMTTVPFTFILDCWDAFEDSKVNFGMGLTTDFGFDVLSGCPLRTRLEWCLEHEKEIFQLTTNQNSLWILKPSVTNKGADISLIKQWDDVLDNMENTQEIREWVLQRYIDPPLLVDGFKFHLRVYVLCIGALRVFVFDQILMLFAAHKYDASDTSDPYRHLTNTAKGVEDQSFSEEWGVQLLDDLAGYLTEGRTTFTSSNGSSHPHNGCHQDPEDSKSGGIDGKAIVSQIRQDIYSITRELFTSFENEYTVFSPMSNCFEIFGLDFLVDNTLNVFLLEVNPGPDFKQTGDRLKRVISTLMGQTCELIVNTDFLIKRSNDENNNENGNNDNVNNDNGNNDNNNRDNSDYSSGISCNDRDDVFDDNNKIAVESEEEYHGNCFRRYKKAEDFVEVYYKPWSAANIKGGGIKMN